MAGTSVTGKGPGSAEGGFRGPDNNRNLLVNPKVVATGFIQTVDFVSVFTVLLPRPFKSGIDNYVVTAATENPLPTNGGSDFTSENYGFNVTKLDDRWTWNGSAWIFNSGVAPGNMKGFVLHSQDPIGGGEGSRSTQIMWQISTVGFDPFEFDPTETTTMS